MSPSRSSVTRQANRRAARLGRYFVVQTLTGVDDLPTEEEAEADQLRDAERRAREQQTGRVIQVMSFYNERRIWLGNDEGRQVFALLAELFTTG